MRTDRRFVAGALAAAACLLAPAAAALAVDTDGADGKGGKTDTERRIDALMSELDAQRAEIGDLKARLAPAPAAQEEGGGGGVGDSVKQWLESEEGRKALDRELFDMGFVKTSIGNLRIGGLLDYWYVSQRDPGTAATRSGVDTFRIRRAEISLSGTIVKDTVDFLVMFDPARQVGSNETTNLTKSTMQDLKIIYKGPFGLPKDVQVTVGQFKIPFGREGFSIPTSKLDFINRADGAVALADARRPGAMVQGAPGNGAVEWFLNVHNNNGQNSQDTTTDQKNLVARLVVNPMKLGTAEESKARTDRWGDLSVGATREMGYETAAHLDFTRDGADAEWRKGGILTDRDGAFLRTEWFRSENDPSLAADKRSHNWAAGYRVDERWEAVARHDVYRDQAGAVERATDTFGINWFLKGHNAKIDLDYIRIRQRTAATGRTLIAQIVLQFQVWF